MTTDEVEELKQKWLKDPTWNISQVVGPKYKKDLLIFRLKHENKWLQEKLDKLESYRQMLKEFLGIDELESKAEMQE